MDYIFGKLANRPEVQPIIWNPDSFISKNQHMLICGGSGAGKTTLLLDIVKYLANAKKHIFLFDLKGDMIVKDDNGDTMGNYIEFTAWDSEYGINPFEFDTGVSLEELSLLNVSGDGNKEQQFKIKNSGPKVQVERLIEIIKKNFLPNMGTYQKDMLMFLLSDTYLSKGFVYNKTDTWLNDLPSLKDTQELIQRIIDYSLNSEGVALQEEDVEFISEIQKDIIGIKGLKNRLSDTDDTAEVEKLIQEKKDKITKSMDEYIEYGINTFKEENISSNAEWFKSREIDISKYSSKEAIRTIEKLSSYINALVESGVFHSSRPPVKNGLNIINISGLDVAIQRFIVDVWLGKVFKSCKIRGTYSERTNKTRGEKCDTFAIIDESKLIAGNSREKNDPYSYLNRIATEARGFGFGLIVAAQSAEHFPEEFLKNFESQVILSTSIADSDSVRKFFGVNKQLLEFTQNGWGNALVKTGKQFNKIKLNSSLST